jgi:hypothetical protein
MVLFDHIYWHLSHIMMKLEVNWVTSIVGEISWCFTSRTIRKISIYFNIELSQVLKMSTFLLFLICNKHLFLLLYLLFYWSETSFQKLVITGWAGLKLGEATKSVPYLKHQFCFFSFYFVFWRVSKSLYFLAAKQALNYVISLMNLQFSSSYFNY